MSKDFKGFETISGKEGKAYAKINGNNEELFFAKALEAKCEKSKGTVKPIGRRMVGHKTMGMEITGSLTLYYYTPIFRQQLAAYKDTGKDLYFDLVVENSDPASSAGRQVMLLKDVNLDDTILALLDGDSDDPLEEECAFTAEDWEPLQHFTKK